MVRHCVVTLVINNSVNFRHIYKAYILCFAHACYKRIETIDKIVVAFVLGLLLASRDDYIGVVGTVSLATSLFILSSKTVVPWHKTVPQKASSFCE